MLLKKTPPWNILVFPASSEIGLELRRALGACKEVVLFGANQPGPCLAQFHFERLLELPSIYDADCLPRLQSLIAEHRIDAIFPAYDDVVVWLAEQAGQLAATVLAPAPEVCNLCRSKRATYAALRDVLPVPKMWDEGIAFPVFVKPDKGQGSQRARRIDDAGTLKQVLAQEPDLIVSEYLPGEEFTVDCFSARQDGVLYAKARRRIQVKAGIATLTQNVDLPEAQEWAQIIMRHIPLHGAWFFQMKRDAKGAFRLLEIAPRIAGSMALTRAVGPNLPLLTLYEAAGVPVTITASDDVVTMGRSLDTRFMSDLAVDALYVDFDDTLVLRDKVNTGLVALVFQYRNRGVPVYLITRHKGDLDAALARFRLSGIFDRVIHITDGTAKAAHITEKHAILIDDSFAEGQQAAAKHIRCFDPAGALCLIDDRQ